MSKDREADSGSTGARAFVGVILSLLAAVGLLAGLYFKGESEDQRWNDLGPCRIDQVSYVDSEDYSTCMFTYVAADDLTYATRIRVRQGRPVPRPGEVWRLYQYKYAPFVIWLDHRVSKEN